MHGELAPEQADLRSVLRAWLQERCPSPTLRGWLDARDPGPFERQFAAAGWAGVGSAEELGGQAAGSSGWPWSPRSWDAGERARRVPVGGLPAPAPARSSCCACAGGALS